MSLPNVYASKTLRGFYAHKAHKDAVKITAQEHADLMDGQSKGKIIDFGDDGVPFLADPAPPEPDTIEQVQAKRQAAYTAESDPLKNEAEYDAIIAGKSPDYAAWLAKVSEIKDRLPLP